MLLGLRDLLQDRLLRLLDHVLERAAALQLPHAHLQHLEGERRQFRHRLHHRQGFPHEGADRRHHLDGLLLLRRLVLEHGGVGLDVDAIAAQLVGAQHSTISGETAMPVISESFCGSKCSAMISALSL